MFPLVAGSNLMIMTMSELAILVAPLHEGWFPLYYVACLLLFAVGLVTAVAHSRRRVPDSGLVERLYNLPPAVAKMRVFDHKVMTESEIDQYLRERKSKTEKDSVRLRLALIGSLFVFAAVLFGVFLGTTLFKAEYIAAMPIPSVLSIFAIGGCVAAIFYLSATAVTQL